jgi:hypothetical protein
MDNNSNRDMPSPAPAGTELLTEICELVKRQFFLPHIKAFSLMNGWHSEYEYPIPLATILIEYSLGLLPVIQLPGHSLILETNTFNCVEKNGKE